MHQQLESMALCPTMPKGPKPAFTPLGNSKLPPTELLTELVHRNIDTAQEQIRRSQEIVAHSHEIVARIKLSLARARHIQSTMVTNNPPLAHADHSDGGSR
jgi:hypothetical protein